MSHAVTTATRLRDKLLAGETIKPSVAAAEFGVTRQQITKSLHQLGEAVKMVRHGQWVCVDADTLARFTPPPDANAVRAAAALQRRMVGFGTSINAWVPLLFAWGMPTRPIDLHLPRTVHRMAMD